MKFKVFLEPGWCAVKSETRRLLCASPKAFVVPPKSVTGCRSDAELTALHKACTQPRANHHDWQWLSSSQCIKCCSSRVRLVDRGKICVETFQAGVPNIMNSNQASKLLHEISKWDMHVSYVNLGVMPAAV
eukprot:scaffold33942_cov18-Tisochrysis_lutea.AAC.1